ncbi:MAG: hypothetical protein IJ630_05825 [Treponema sp.]|nr:hypothetical protein [Treponema sp.]
MNNYFDDSDYFASVFSNDASQTDVNECAKANSISDGRLKTAYKQAADIRKFEIDLFWKRGTYYWAFILAAFTAHFTLLGMIFSTFGKEVKNELSLKNMCALPGLSLFALAVTAFFCFFFSLAWTLVNKGSKFWQKNWEAHIDMLEENVTGNLYKTFLNTNFKCEEKAFSKNPLCYKAYDYSVTTITTLTSILLTIVSGGLFCFYVELFIFRCVNKQIQANNLLTWIVPICTIVFLTVIYAIFYFETVGNNFQKNKNTVNRWHQRSKNYADNHQT